jgi:glycosyltransferase involved in cell wall biosynthesis
MRRFDRGGTFLRVLFVTWDGPQVNYLESLFLPIFEGLKPHGFEFDVLQFRWGTQQQERAVREACRVSGSGYHAVKVWRWGGALGPFVTALLGGWHVRRAVRRFKSDILMPRSVLPSLATLVARGAALRPVLMDADGMEIDERVEFSGMQSTSLAYRILRDVESQMVRLSRAILVRTPAARDMLIIRAGPALRPNQFHIVPNGRDGRLFHPFDEAERIRVRAELGLPHHAPVIVYVGSVGGKYTIRSVGELALELRKLRPDTRLLVLTAMEEAARAELFGPFPELETFTTLFRAAPDDVPRYIAAGDVGTAFIKPTFSMRAVAPVKTAEYLLCGVPVVGIAEVGDNAMAVAEGVYFDESRGLGEAARWIAETVLPNREDYRVRARAVGESGFSLESSVRSYLAALQAVTLDAGQEHGFERDDAQRQR